MQSLISGPNAIQIGASIAMRNRVNKSSSALLCAVGVLLTLPCGAQPLKHWSFDKHNNREGWDTSAQMIGAVMGGAVWISIRPSNTEPSNLSGTSGQLSGNQFLDSLSKPKAQVGQAYKETNVDMLQSPQGLALRAIQSDPISVKLRILNLSPITDIFLRWKTRGAAEYSGERRCSLRGELKEWQEITCFFDATWQGIADSISLAVPQSVMRGDLWIDDIQVATGIQEPVKPRPDLASARVVPTIVIPNLSQEGFADAFKVLDENLIVDVPVSGFSYPVVSPGFYAENWWTMDSSMSLKGAKWSNQTFAENVLRGFHDVQAPDGRIPDRGNAGARGQVGDFSQIPRLFEGAFDVVRRSTDAYLREQAYDMMRRYLDWWLSPVKRDSRTGLVSGVGEETANEHDPFEYGPQTRAHVDTNVAVAVGAHMAATLAHLLGKEDEARRYQKSFQELGHAINIHCWDEKDGAYYNFDLISQRRMPRLMVSTFDPLRFGIAPSQRRERLSRMLLNPALFNWSPGPLTGLAKTEPDYQDVFAKGEFSYANGIKAWFGDVTTFRNIPVIKGLKESGLPQMAAELNWATITAFHSNYAEHLFPIGNRGDGAKRYSWSAAEYIEAVIDHLFGVDFSALEKRVRITPLVPKSLYGKELALSSLILPTGGNTRMSLKILQTSATRIEIEVNIEGDLPEGIFEVGIPGKTRTVPSAKSAFTVSFR